MIGGRLVTINQDPAYKYTWHAPKRSLEFMEEAPALEFSLWYDAILNDTPPIVLPEQSYAVSRVISAIYESAEKNDVVYFKDKAADEL